MGKIAVLLVGVFIVASSVSAENFCANSKTGQIRMLFEGQSCKAVKEIPVIIGGQQGPPGPKGDIGPMGLTGPAGPPGLLTVDSMGQQVGYSVTLNEPLYIQSFNAIVAFGPDGLVTEVGEYNLFESSDCSGEPNREYIQVAKSLYGVERIWRLKDKHFIWIDAKVTKPIASKRFNDGRCLQICERKNLRCFTGKPPGYCIPNPDLPPTSYQWDEKCEPIIIGDDSNDAHWITVDMEVMAPGQEVTLPFTVPVALPLKFQ